MTVKKVDHNNKKVYTIDGSIIPFDRFATLIGLQAGSQLRTVNGLFLPCASA